VSIEIKFEVEDQPERSGVVPESIYLWDAAKRLGVHLKAECDGRGDCDTCAVTILKGREMLSTATSAEMQHLTDERRKNGERLACQARIERNGELTIMVKKQEVEEEEPKKGS
jgi:ferredoxin